jgi:hypothetical protein
MRSLDKPPAGPRRAALIAALLALAPLTFPTTAQVDPADETDYEFDDRAVLLATLVQPNGNTLEFLSNPESEELTLWETGVAERAAPVFATVELGRLSMLERYLLLVPEGFPVPEDLARFSQLDPRELETLLAGRRLVATVPGVVEVGDQLAQPPWSAAAPCTNIGTANYWDWGPVYRESGCSAYSGSGSTYAKARICNKSGYSSIKMQLGYKHFCSSSKWNWPNSKTKNIAAGNYGAVSIQSVPRCRRARYTNWDVFYEKAIVGGWFECTYQYTSCGGTSNTCDG